MKKKHSLTLRINQELLDKVACIAEQSGQSRGEQIEVWLNEYISLYEAEHGEIEISEDL